MNRWQSFFNENPDLAFIQPSLCSQRAISAFQSREKQNILDLGCGTGRDTKALFAAFPNIIGLDFSIAALKLAHQINLRRLVQSDARALPFKNDQFDGVYCFGLLHEFTTESAPLHVHKTMKEIYRILQHDGILILSVLAGNPEEGLPHVRLFSLEMLLDATKSFSLLEILEYDDIGCTGKHNYHIWSGTFLKTQ